MDSGELSLFQARRLNPSLAPVAATDSADAFLGPWIGSATPTYARDLTGKFLAVNAAFARKFGRFKTDKRLQLVLNFIHPDDTAGLNSAAAELQRSPHQITRVHRWLTPQGWRWMSWEESSVFDDSGDTVAVRAVGHDITRQRLAEELYQKLSRAVEQSPVAMAITDQEGRAQYVNPKFTQAFGYTLEEIFERNIPVLKEGHPTDESYDKFWETVNAGLEWQGELMRHRAGGRKVWESVTVTCLRNVAGEITNLL